MPSADGRAWAARPRPPKGPDVECAAAKCTDAMRARCPSHYGRRKMLVALDRALSLHVHTPRDCEGGRRCRAFHADAFRTWVRHFTNLNAELRNRKALARDVLSRPAVQLNRPEYCSVVTRDEFAWPPPKGQK